MQTQISSAEIDNKKDSIPFKTKVKWYQIEKSQLEVRLSTDFSVGLTDKRVGELHKRYGKNVFSGAKRASFLIKIINQLKSPLVLILLIAGVATLFLKEYLDAGVIFLALFVNLIIGLFQEGRASKAFEKLNKSQQKYATVVRGGRRKRVLAEDVVVGDLVILEAGMGVPADVRILEETDLTVNEAPLTGEWVSVEKDSNVINKNVSISKQTNMAWMGTLIASGFGKGVVVEIGGGTEFGSIAKELAKEDVVKTPIQKSIHKLAVFISYVSIASVFVIFALGLVRGESLFEMLLLSIAVAVSIVPEGLPAVLTATLAIGMEKILKKGGLVRNLLAAETLGSTTIIITDKTGTLTQAKMRIESLFSLDVLAGDCSEDKKNRCNSELLKMAVLSSDAFVEENETEEGGVIVRGRSIEKAIVMAGLEANISQEKMKDDERIDFLPFSSENRFAVSLNKQPKSQYNRLYFSGSPEHILAKSSFVYQNSKKTPISDEVIKIFTDIQSNKGAEGKRMTAIAYKDIKGDEIKRDAKDKMSKDVSKNLVFVGILVFSDPIRPDVRGAIKIVKGAGARVIMATGDNKGTAKTIAIGAGVARSNSEVLTGSDIENLSDEELYKKISTVKIFARVLPSQKLRMVNVLRNHGEIVAMTGDGINDAPALRSADIGIAVGSGTDVAKEASDLILLDNSFSIIVSAIKEGRRIIDNLKKIISHLVSTSFGEIFLIAGAFLFAVPLPILPAQILWVNIVEGGLLNFAFAFEPAEDSVMKRNPRSSSASNLVTGNIKKLIFAIGSITGLFTLALYMFLRNMGLPIEELRTVMFVTLSFDSIFFILSMKSFSKPIWKINIFTNRFLLISIITSVITLFAALAFEPLRNLLSLTTLHPIDVVALVFVAAFNMLTIETAKYYIFWRKPKVLVN